MAHDRACLCSPTDGLQWKGTSLQERHAGHVRAARYKRGCTAGASMGLQWKAIMSFMNRAGLASTRWSMCGLACSCIALARHERLCNMVKSR